MRHTMNIYAYVCVCVIQLVWMSVRVRTCEGAYVKKFKGFLVDRFVVFVDCCRVMCHTMYWRPYVRLRDIVRRSLHSEREIIPFRHEKCLIICACVGVGVHVCGNERERMSWRVSDRESVCVHSSTPCVYAVGQVH